MTNVGDADALAAEYVLGTLDSNERQQARSLLTTDAAFAAKVKLWEHRLGELHLMVEAVEPDLQLWERVRAKIPQVEEDEPVQPAEAVPPEPPPIPTIPSSLGPEPPPIPSPEPQAPSSAPALAEGPLVPPPAVAERAAQETTTSPSEVPALPVLPVFVPGPAAAPAQAPKPPPAVSTDRADARIRRRLARWRALALLMTLVVLAVAGLLAAWRFAPDRVPPGLRPVELLRLVGVALPAAHEPPRRPVPPPESRFDE